jgi:DNA-binding transcriptional ArsR family regulator
MSEKELKEVFVDVSDASPQDVFKAISDPSRRKILKILQRGSRNAGELAQAFDFTKGSLSHHFNILKAANLVRCERRGQQIVYMLNMSVFEETVAMLLDLFGGQKGPAEREGSHEAQSR